MPFDSHGRTLSFAEAYTTIGGLSNPSKMPWYAWSISAKTCITGSKLREVAGSTCSHCYACKGFYPLPVVQDAMERRRQALGHPQFVPAFVLVLSTLYWRARRTYRLEDGTVVKENRFRWHDSGDLQSVEHLVAINTIAELTPFLEHYCPSREAAIIRKFLALGHKAANNLHLKLSHPMIGQTFARAPMGLAFSTVGRDDDPALFQCPAKRFQGNKCRDCHRCWTDSNINYPLRH